MEEVNPDILKAKNFLEEGKLSVIIVHFTLDQRADPGSRLLGGRNIGQLMDHRRNLLIDSALDNGNSVFREQLRQRRVAPG